MKKGFGKIGILACGLAGLGVAAPVPSPGIVISTTQSQKPVKEQNVQPVKSAKQIVVQSAGGFDIIGHNTGIPPHIYGTNYVKRGTHKRTNKYK